MKLCLTLKCTTVKRFLNLDSTNKTLYFLYKTFYNLIISKESINMEELALFFFLKLQCDRAGTVLPLIKREYDHVIPHNVADSHGAATSQL